MRRNPPPRDYNQYIESQRHRTVRQLKPPRVIDNQGSRVRESLNWFFGICGVMRKSFLDVGCRDGYSLVLARRRRAVRTLGVELLPEAVEFCRKLRLNVVEGDARKLSISDNQWERVTLCHVLEHIPQPMEAICEASRVCRGNGRLLFTVPNEHGRPTHKHGHFVAWECLEEFAEFVRKGGVHILRAELVEYGRKGQWEFRVIGRPK